MKIKTSKNTLLVLDAIPFFGGSKVATKAILRQLISKNIHISILSEDPQAWEDIEVTTYKLPKLPIVWRSETGLSYYIKHFWIGIFLLFTWLRSGRSTSVLGTSGPGVDLSIYMFKVLFPGSVSCLQLVHGPVGKSRTIARCLIQADLVAHLDSTKASMENAMTSLMPRHAISYFFSDNKFQRMINGIPNSLWPTPTNSDFTSAKCLWAASLLKWKGLHYLANALSYFPTNSTPESVLCYIPAKHTDLPLSDLPEGIPNMEKYESPSDLDRIRASCNIFISTSDKEPFGMSILEAMASGLCIVIPSDGAYWDQVLKNDIDCIKYSPRNSKDLCRKLNDLCKNMGKAKQLGENAAKKALNYRAETCYSAVCLAIEKSVSHTTFCEPKSEVSPTSLG